MLIGDSLFKLLGRWSLFIGLLQLVVMGSCKNATDSASIDVAPAAPMDSAQVYVWTKLLDSAEWRKNYNFQMFSIGDTLWTFHPDGTWYSADGKQWNKSPLTNAIDNLAFLDYVHFKGAVYGLGNFHGNIEQHSLKSTIYTTRDFQEWITLAEETNLPKRFFYHPFVFRDRLWIIGGEDGRTQYSDIWNSEDGISWTLQKDHLPFGNRSGSQVVLLRDTLYLMDNDVWRSVDGLLWEQVTGAIVPGEQIFGYSAQVMDDQIWLLGCNRNGQFSSNVLHSADGKHWESQDAPWLPRGGIAATVHRGNIYMTGGKYGGTPNHPDFRYDNDVWMLGRR